MVPIQLLVPTQLLLWVLAGSIGLPLRSVTNAFYSFIYADGAGPELARAFAALLAVVLLRVANRGASCTMVCPLRL